jgi:hypothetical protein
MKSGYHKAVGTVVYVPFTPQQPGKVIRVVDKGGRPDGFDERVEVRWLKKGNPTSVERSFYLRSLPELIADHEKKLDGHRKRLKQAEAL